MRDLTVGPVRRHVVQMALPMAAGMIFQTAYYLVDLFFVGRLGDVAIAGVSTAGTVQFIVLAVTQVLGIGATALIAQAAGRKDFSDVRAIFQQSLWLAGLCAALTLAIGYLGLNAYMQMVAATAESADAGASYLRWYLPGIALQFWLAAMGAGLRGSGVAKPTMIVQMVSVLLNMVLAPVLIAGWLTGKPMGVAGAGLASTIAVVVGFLLLLRYTLKHEQLVATGSVAATRRLEFGVWGRILKIGLPAGGEFALMFVYVGLVHWILRKFGAEAQAGFGVGSRVMQSLFLPAMAIAFAAAPVAGQNFGARLFPRVRDTFKQAAILSSIAMALLTLVAQLEGDTLVRLFAPDDAVVGIATEFLRIAAWNFVANGLIFTCSGMFQALGNTLPSLLSSATRLLSFAVPAVLIARRPGFEVRHLWYLSLVTVTMQMVLSLLLLRFTLRSKLRTAEG